MFFFSRRNFNYKYRNSFSTSASVFESIELGISLLVRRSIGDVVFVASAAKIRLNYSVSTVKKIPGKPRKGVSPSTVYISSPNVKSKRKYKEKRMFYSFASL